MALTFQKAIRTQEQLNLALAKRSNIYSEQDFLDASAIGYGDAYSAALAGLEGLSTAKFNDEYYKRFSVEDKLSYLNYAFYEKDSEKNKLYKEYFDYKYDEAIDAEAYAQLSGFQKTINSIGGILGNAMNDLFVGTIEGLIDMGATLNAALNISDAFGVSDKESKEFIAKDFTGYSKNRKDLQRWIRANTYIDKNEYWKVANEITDSIAKMTPMFIGNALAPVTGGASAGVGQAMYFGAMAGNTAEEAVITNPDISTANLFWYTAAVTGVEFGTEKLSALIFPSATDVAAGMGSATKRAAVGNIFARLGLDFASEFTEEFVSEFMDSVLYQSFVDQSTEIASISDCLYAGLIGGLTGALMAGAETTFTKRGYITSNGELISLSKAKKQGLTDGTKLSKIQTLNLKEQIAAVQEAGSKSYVTDLQNKYKGETLQDIQKNHADEYNRAIEKDAKYKEDLAKTTLALSKILDDIGVENFNKAVDIANSTFENIQRTANNYVNTLTGKTTAERAVEKSFNEAFGEFGDSFAVSEGLTLREQELQKALAEQGINVHFGKIGNKEHLTQNYRVLGNQIFLDSETTANMSLDTILNKVVNEALVEQCVDLMNMLSKEESVKLFKDLISSMGLTSADFNNNFKKAMTEKLLFDEKTISMSMITNHKITDKIYNLLHKQKNIMDHQKTFKKKDKIKYNKLAKIMQKYRNVLASEIGNAEDLKSATEQMGLTAEEALDVENKYLPDFTTAHYTWLKENHTLNAYRRKQATRVLLNNRVVKDVDSDIDYNNVFNANPNDYYTEAFINKIMSRNPNQTFQYNLNEYLINTYSVVIHPRSECMMEVVDYTKYTNNDFDASLEMLPVNSNAMEGFETLDQIFGKRFKDKFLRSDGTNELSEIRLKFIVKDQIGVTKAQYERNAYEVVNDTKVPMGPTITVFIKPTMTLNDAAALRHNLLHETTHALSDLQGLSNGVSSKYVRQSLVELNNDYVLHKLAKQVLTDEFYQANKNNKQVLLDNVAYQIYSLTDGEFAAEAYEQSKIREGDSIVRLKSGSAMNQSGFVVNGEGQLIGFGEFNNIVLPTPIETQTQGDYTSKAFKNATEITATQEESESNVGKISPVDIANNNIEKWLHARARDFRTGFKKSYLTNTLGLNIKDKLSFIEAGFSEEFYDAVSTDKFSREKLSAMIAPTDESGMATRIGTEERTNEIIKLLYPDNVNVKSFEDINNILQTDDKGFSGLTYAVVYGNIIKQTEHPNFKKAHTITELREYFDKHPELIETLNKQQNKIDKLLEGYDNIYNKLLKTDYDYSFNNTKTILAELGNRSETSKEHTREVSLSDKNAESKAAELEDTESNVEDIIARSMEELSPNAQLIVDKLDLKADDAFEKIDNVRRMSKQQLKNLFEESYDFMMNEYLKTESEYKAELKDLQKQLTEQKLTSAEARILNNALKNNVSPADYLKSIDDLTSLLDKKLNEEKPQPKFGRNATQSEIDEINATKLFRGDNLAGITKFDNTKGNKKRIVPGVVWLTNNRYAGSTYAMNDKNSRVYGTNINVKNPLVVDFEGNLWSKGIDGKTTDQIVEEAKAAGYDSVIFQNVIDVGPNVHKIQNKSDLLTPSTNVAVFDSDNVTITEESDIINSDEYYRTHAKETTKINPEIQKANQIIQQSTTTSKESENIINYIENAFEDRLKDVSEAQFFDEADMTYTTVGYEMIEQNAAIFSLVTNENYDEIRNALKRNDKFYADQMLLVFDLYTHEMMGKFSPEIQAKIENYNRRELTKSAQKLALQSQRVAERKGVTNAVNSLAKQKIKVTVDDAVLQKYILDNKTKDQRIAELKQKIKELDAKIRQLSEKTIRLKTLRDQRAALEDEKIKNQAKITELSKEIERLNEEMSKEKSSEDLLAEMKDASDEKLVLTNGTNEDIADFKLNQEADEGVEGAERSAKKASDLLQEILKKATIALEDGKNVRLVTIDENGQPKAFPKAREKLIKWMNYLQSFRMWAMLSSPVTWFRNFLGNAGMRGLEKTTNAVERLFTKTLTDEEFQKLKEQRVEPSKKLRAYDQELGKLNKTKESINAQLTNIKNEVTKATPEEKANLEKQRDDVQAQIDAWKEKNQADYDKLKQEVKGIDFKMHQLSLNATKATANTIAYVNQNFSYQIDEALTYDEGKYAYTTEQKESKVKNMKREALEIQMKQGTGLQKLTAWAKWIELQGLDFGWTGDKNFLRRSIKTNLANAIESNKAYFKQVLQEQLQATNDPAKRAKIENAINSNDAGTMFGLMTKEETSKIFDKCVDLAMEQYFKNSNFLSRALAKLAKKSRVAATLVSFIYPFPKVAANILSMAYKYSPLGFIDALKKKSIIKQMEAGNYTNFTGFEKADLAKTQARASVGTFMLIAGALMAALGFIDIDDDDYMGPSLEVFGGLKISLSNLAPSMTTFSTGAAMLWAAKNHKNPVNQALQTLYDNTLLGNVENIFKYGSIENWASSMSISFVGQYVPSVLKLITKTLTSNGVAKDKSDSNYFMKLIKTLGSYVPGADQFVPNKINPYTGEKQYSTGTDKWWANLLMGLSPLTMKWTGTTGLENEAIKLGAETTGLSGNFKINDSSYSLHGKEKEALAKYRANYVNDRYEAIKSGKEKITIKDKKTNKYKTTTYDKLTDEEKKTVLNRIYDDATEMSKIQYWTSQSGNYYIVTDKQKATEYKKLVSNSSKIIYKTSWSQSKYITK